MICFFSSNSLCILWQQVGLYGLPTLWHNDIPNFLYRWICIHVVTLSLFVNNQMLHLPKYIGQIAYVICSYGLPKNIVYFKNEKTLCLFYGNSNGHFLWKRVEIFSRIAWTISCEFCFSLKTICFKLTLIPLPVYVNIIHKSLM